MLKGLGISHTSYSANDGGCTEIDNVHVTTFKSAKGLEFDTVIIPDFDSMNRLCNNVRYNGIINQNDYYVGVTRARTNLYLFSSQHLANLSSYVDSSTLS